MKFLTKFIVSGSPKAKRFDMDIEAESPEKAAKLADKYWRENWSGPEITTETSVHVHGYKSGSGEPDKQLLYNLMRKSPGYEKVVRKQH